MAASDYDFNLTRNQIVEAALGKIGVLGQGEVMRAEMLSEGVRALNLVLKEWANDGVTLWKYVEISQNITSGGGADYTLGNEVLAVDQVWYLNGTTYDPVRVVSHREYLDIPDKASTGSPLLVAIDYALATPVLYVYPTPDANYTLKLYCPTRIKDMDTAGGNADIQKEFLNALVYALAFELTPEYGVPLGERNWVKNIAAEKYAKAKNADQEYADEENTEGAYDEGAYRE